MRQSLISQEPFITGTEFLPKILLFPPFHVFHFLPLYPSVDQEAVDENTSSGVSAFILQQGSSQKLYINQATHRAFIVQQIRIKCREVVRRCRMEGMYI